MQELGLPYRVVNIAAGDLGASATKKYDIEAWFPGQQRYREISSTSNTTDYQARRLGVRFRRDGKLEPVHTLNGTAMTARWLIALMENFQDEGGAIAVPEVLTHSAPRPSWPERRSSSGGYPAAFHADHLAVDVSGAVRGEEHDRFGDLAGIAETLHRVHRLGFLDVFRVEGPTRPPSSRR